MIVHLRPSTVTLLYASVVMEAPSPNYDPELVQGVQYLEARKKVLVGALALLIYDPLLTLHQEYKYIWRARWTAGKAMYLWLRYGPIAFQAVLYGKSLFGTNVSPSHCRLVADFDTCTSVLTHQLVHLTMALRVSAVYGNQRRAGLIMAAGFLVSFAFTVFIDYSWYAHLVFPPVNNGLELGCVGICVGCEPYVRAVWAPGVFFDTLLFGLTIFGIVRQGGLFNTRLLTVLYRDNFSYFFLLYGLETALLLLFNIAPLGPGSLVMNLSGAFLQGHFRTLICVGCCRMILNLRGVLMKPSELNGNSNRSGNTALPTTIRFAPLGGTPSSGSMTTWTTPSNVGTASFTRSTKSALDKVVEDDSDEHELEVLGRKVPTW